MCKFIYVYVLQSLAMYNTYVPAVYFSYYSNLWFVTILFYVLWMQR